MSPCEENFILSHSTDGYVNSLYQTGGDGLSVQVSLARIFIKAELRCILLYAIPLLVFCCLGGSTSRAPSYPTCESSDLVK